MTAAETIEWLEDKGFKRTPWGDYEYRYRDGDYGACIRFPMEDITAAPIKYFEVCFEEFLERAERKEIW